MFGFLAALGPVGIAAAVVGTVATAVVASNSSSSSKGSNRREVQDDYDENKKEDISKDIERYKEISISSIKNKYDADIQFVANDVSSSTTLGTSSFYSGIFDDSIVKKDKIKVVRKNTVIDNEIKKLKNEVDEISMLIEELEAAKHEAIR